MPYAAETVAKSWEPGGRLLSTVVTRQAGHDAYGNVGTVEISTTAGGETFRKVTASTYRNLIDTNRWLLGRLTRAQVTHVDASGNSSVKTSAFTYYEGTHGLLQQEIIEPDSTAPGIRQTTTYEYDRFGNVTRTTVAGTDSAGRAISRSSQSAYTADGRFVQSATNALGHSERHTVDARFGELTEMTGPNAQTTRWDFDGFGRKTAERRADGTATLWERAWIAGDDAAAPPNAVYRLAQQDTAAADSGRLPPVVQYLDEKGRALRSVSTGFDGSATYQDIEYDTRGREVAKSLPYFAGDEPYWAETFYDDLDRVVRKVGETSRQVHVASLAYDGLKTTETDSLGRDKSTWTNAEGKVVAVQEEEGAFIEYDYDPRGNLIRTVQGDDHTGKTAETTIAYDQRDRKIAMQDADLGRWTYGYNSFGESEWQQDAVGNRTELVYDTLGRTVRRNDLPAGGTAQTTAWTFDSAPRGGGVWLGKLARIDGPAPGYRVDVSYDTLGRELTASQQTDGKTFTVANEYDSFGRVAATTQPGGFRIEHRYNASGFLVEQRTPAQPSVDGYDPAFVRSLLAETAVSATKALNAAAQYAEQAAWFQRKSAEYETVIRQLIQDQQLAPGAPNLGTAAFALLRDDTGTLYLRTQAGTPSERLYRLTQASAGWSLQAIDSAAAPALLAGLRTTGDSFYFGDFNADGTRDFIRVPNGSSDRPLPQCDSTAARQTNALAAGSPDLHGDGALPILTDTQGTEYFTAPQHTIIVHGAVATPVVTRRTGHYRLAFDTGAARWRLEPIDAEVWAAFTAPTLSDTGRRIAFGDFDNNGQADFRRLDRNGNPVQLAARTNPGCATIAEASPLIDRGVFDGLMQTAATIRSAARTLQREAETAVSLARDLILVAADLRDRARQSELWAAGSSASDLQALTAENGWIVLWRATARDASGRLTAERAGNGLITTRDYDPADGHLASIQTGYQYGSLLRYLTYEYDAENNVVARHDELAAADETFDYDALDRLTASHLRGTLYSQPYSASIDYRYDALGNISYKSDIGNYVSGDTGGPMDHAGPHAVHEVSGRGLYRYDANGNLLQGGGRTIAWSNDNLPVRLSKGAAAVEFAYGPDRNRYKKTVRSGGSLTETTWYVGKGYERIEKSGAVTHKYFVQGDDGVAAIYVRQESNGAIDPSRDQLRYLHRDALGSVDTITDGRGVAIERSGFQPFGARLGAGWTTSVAGVLPFTNRGFTGHEHIDEIGLIHMNGRVYDPELGRFLSADPFVQAPNNSQSYNRYSYVMNNPMKYTDPSGYFLSGFLRGIGNALQSAFSFVKDNFRMIAAIGLSAMTGGLSLLLNIPAVVAGALTGFVGSYVMTGSLSAAVKGAVIGGISAGLAYGIGHGIDWTHFGQFAEAAKTVAHGVAQGLVSEIQGGDFKSGFLGGMIGHVAGGQANRLFKGVSLGAIAGRTSVAAIAGSASAELGGGKFASGAMSATFAHLFNSEAGAVLTARGVSVYRVCQGVHCFVVGLEGDRGYALGGGRKTWFVPLDVAFSRILVVNTGKWPGSNIDYIRDGGVKELIGWWPGSMDDYQLNAQAFAREHNEEYWYGLLDANCNAVTYTFTLHLGLAPPASMLPGSGTNIDTGGELAEGRVRH